MTKFPTQIQHDNFAIKLEARYIDGTAAHGAGFAVRYKDRFWLVTCRHLLEHETFNFSGRCDARTIQAVSPTAPPIGLQGRLIVGVRIQGVIADAAAIEISEAEAAGFPKFDGLVAIPISGYQPRSSFTLNLGTMPVPVPVHAEFHVQGYPSLSASQPPVTIETVTNNGFPSLHPWMLAYIPGAANGFSGGPVIKLTAAGAQLWGIHTHSYDATLDGTTGGMGWQAQSRLGGAVPISLLFRAIDRASGTAETIIDVT